MYKFYTLLEGWSNKLNLLTPTPLANLYPHFLWETGRRGVIFSRPYGLRFIHRFAKPFYGDIGVLYVTPPGFWEFRIETFTINMPPLPGLILRF